MDKMRNSLLNNRRSESYENTMVSGENRYKHLPDYSLRVRGTIHSKAHALKDIGLYDNINQVLEEAINELLKKKSEDIQNEVNEEAKRNNEMKLRKIKHSRNKKL
ncbi:hypothetical protein QVA72_12485 [Staphylococcus simulans]|uniref:Phage protein n=1 Tax=Staphylococcus simulans UMC-CNS-990 TaxID=1405498 RepID=A0ABN0PA48_STASI|nr:MULTISPECIES: hypothetical protein [Staphylococcus]ERS92451.1 hypothetical protein SSIM_11990 [Staphylococcus simulans UMC-CNS-990]EZR66276.1 hypothetical protein W787_02576 [Staphylococcus aureus VET1422S]KAG50012.1 hypothetical protein W771_02504 [Staphylococcus aureus VET1035S]KAG53749.1 hypothetical protein W772_02485 [Staphylococcus aureus VET1048S]MCE5150105.1 hypothetical protein [Staphylococcus simulans]